VEEETAQLPEAYRLPVLLCVHEGRTVAEAAQLLGWTAGSVRGRLARGRDRLQARLARRGLLPSAALAAAGGARGQATQIPARPGGTVRAALAFAGGKAAGSVGVSAQVTALAEAGVKGVALSRAKLALVLLLAAGVAVAGMGTLAHEPPAAKPAAAGQDGAPRSPAREAGQAQPEGGKPDRADRYGDPLPPGAVARIGPTRLQGTDQVYVAAYSPDGRLFATGHGASIARLWDAKSGKLLLEMPLAVRSKPNFGPSSVTALAFSP